MGPDEALLPTGRRAYAMNLPASTDPDLTKLIGVRLRWGDRELDSLRATDSRDWHRRTDAVLRQEPQQIVDAAHR